MREVNLHIASDQITIEDKDGIEKLHANIITIGFWDEAQVYLYTKRLSDLTDEELFAFRDGKSIKA